LLCFNQVVHLVKLVVVGPRHPASYQGLTISDHALTTSTYKVKTSDGMVMDTNLYQELCCRVGYQLVRLSTDAHVQVPTVANSQAPYGMADLAMSTTRYSYNFLGVYGIPSEGIYRGGSFRHCVFGIHISRTSCCHKSL